MRGDAVDREQIAGARDKDQQTTYGLTLGGPIIRNKLFFFFNGEIVNTPTIANRWRGSTDGVADPDNYVSRTTLSDLETVSNFVKNKYGYDTGSWTSFPADESNKSGQNQCNCGLENQNNELEDAKTLCRVEGNYRIR